MKKYVQNVWCAIRTPVGRLMMAFAVMLGVVATTAICRADDISDAITSVSGYETAAVAVGIAVLLFTLGRRVVRRLICAALMLGGAGLMNSLFTANAHATGDDITTVITSVSGYETAAVAVGVAVLLFVLGKRVVRRLI